MRELQSRGPSDAREVTRWMVGCAVGAAATIGVVILVFLVALALQPPAWVQIVVGIGLAVGATVFTWLVASAWRPSAGPDELAGRRSAPDLGRAGATGGESMTDGDRAGGRPGSP